MGVSKKLGAPYFGVLIIRVLLFRVPYQALGGSWLVISGVISRLTIVITHIRGLITPDITTPEPPSINCLSISLSEGEKFVLSGPYEIRRCF